jgi:hypothetical protein
MKLTPPPIEIEEYEGFLPEKDIFQRKGFAEKLSNLIENVSDELVLAIDAPWGEGKTTFVRMWQGMLKEQGVESIYFDAFQNDFLEDPLLALVGEVYSLLDDEETDTKVEFKTKAVSAIKTIGKASIRIGLKAITAGILDETVLKGAGAEKEVADMSDSYISSRLDSLKGDKASIEEFKVALSATAEAVGNGNKIVFIIDELDRCKPSFALDLLEKIKHIFSVPGIVFVLVMNREQMDEVIRSRYGAGIDSTKYLQKFVHIWTGLPKSPDGHTSNGKKYLNDCLERMEFELKTRTQQVGLEFHEELIGHYNISLREIERSLSNYAIIHNLTKGDLNPDYLWLSIYLCVVKVLYPNTYRKLALGNISYDKVIKETELQSFEADHWKDDKPEGHPIRWLLKYYLSDEEEVKELLTHGDFSEARDYGRSAIVKICGWLETFKR